MSTQQIAEPKPASDVVAKIDKWNDEHFKLVRAALKNLGPAPYPRAKEFDQNLAGIKKLPVEDRAAKYTDELVALQSLGQKLLADKGLESDAKKPIALDIKAAKEKINAELSADALEIKSKTATPVQPSTGGSTGGPARGPTARVVTPPPPGDAFVSNVFKNGKLKADMFHLPDSMSKSQLEGLCLQYNYVMKQFMGIEGERMKELTAGGMPLAGKQKTGQVDATKIKTMIDMLWEKKEVTEGTKPDLPTAEKIQQLEIGWTPGSTEDKIKKYRATEIANVKVAGPKEAFVTAAALENANKELTKVGSFIRLVPSGPADKDGFVPIRPEWNPDRKITAEHAESHAKLLKLNQERQASTEGSKPVGKDQQYVSWADCHRTAQSIMGSEDTASGIKDTEHVLIPSPTGPKSIPPIPKQISKTIASASDFGANRAMHALFNETMPAFKEQLIKEAGGVDKLSQEAKHLIGQIDEAVKTANPGEPANFRATYKAICNNPELHKKFSAANGVNSAVKPEVGDALAQINDEYEKANAPKGTDLWNFHFAGVVLANKDGSYMTMENLSVEDTNAVNDDWYFAVYDPKQGKDFHTVNAEDDHVGESPITIQFRKKA
jgi:hypothetical protein